MDIKREEDAPEVAGLTRRQTAILRLTAEGLYAKEIARELGISTRTVEGHLAAMRKRSGTRNLRELVAWWVATGANTSHGGDSAAVAGAREETGRGPGTTRESPECPRMPDFSDIGSALVSPDERSDQGYARQGRPTVMTAEAITQARSLLATHTIKAIAIKLGVSRSTLYKHMHLIRSLSPGSDSLTDSDS
jgi:DNA-binding CsgD family transcriptional regulator